MLMVQGLKLGYNNLQQQQLNGLEGFYGMDMVNASIVVTTTTCLIIIFLHSLMYTMYTQRS